MLGRVESLWFVGVFQSVRAHVPQRARATSVDQASVTRRADWRATLSSTVPASVSVDSTTDYDLYSFTKYHCLGSTNSSVHSKQVS